MKEQSDPICREIPDSTEEVPSMLLTTHPQAARELTEKYLLRCDYIFLTTGDMRKGTRAVGLSAGSHHSAVPEALLGETGPARPQRHITNPARLIASFVLEEFPVDTARYEKLGQYNFPQ